MLNNSHTTLLRASGEVRLEFILQLIKSLMFFVPSIILGVHFYGLTGAAIGFTVATFLSITLSFFFMNKVFDLKFKQIIVAVKVPLIMFVFCLITTEFLKTLIDWRFCLIYYLIAVFVIYFWLAKTQIRSLFNEVKDSLRKNKRD
jgi:O-antigen/teichoic acid export membrane protein